MWQSRESYSGLLRDSNAGEKQPKTNGLFAILGVLFIGAGYGISIIVEKPISQMVPYLFSAVVLVIIGTYMLFTAGSIALLKILRSKKNYYYKTKHFISISNMLYRMKQNAVGLANICILSTMVLVMVSSTSSLVFGMDNIIQMQYPNDFNVYSNETDQTQSEETFACIHKLQKEQKLNVTGEMYYTFLMISAINDHDTFLPVLPDAMNDDNKEAKGFVNIIITHIANGNKNEERLVNIMGGTVIETESDKIKIRMIIELGQEDGLDDDAILKRLQEKIIGLPLKRAEAYLEQYGKQLV